MNLGTRIPHPIPYQGSKRFLAQEILSRMPDRFERLVEPFAGSAAISLAVASKGMAQRFWINDAHQPLANLWQAILGNPNALAGKYRSLWQKQQGREREFFNLVRDRFNDRHQPEDFLYLLARCVKAAIRYNSDGKFNNTPDNRRKGAKPDEMRTRILGAAALLAEKTTVTAVDYRDVLGQCERSDLIYMDPPYQGVCAVRDHRYAPKVCHDEFSDALAELNKRGCRYIVSYDGRTGDKQFGKPLPKSLRLIHLEVFAGRSSQATLLGRDDITYESLYLSPSLADRIGDRKNTCPIRKRQRFLEGCSDGRSITARVLG
jgi:DNA adenine methylase